MVLPVRVLTKICMVPFFDSLFTKSRQGLSVPSLTPSLMRNCDVSLLLSLSLSLFLSLFWLEIEKKKKSGGGGRKERDFYTRKEKNSELGNFNFQGIRKDSDPLDRAQKNREETKALDQRQSLVISIY